MTVLGVDAINARSQAGDGRQHQTGLVDIFPAVPDIT